MPNSLEKPVKYMIRHAAGLYYLVFLGEDGYRKPLRMNDSAYFIYERYMEGQDKESIAQALAGEYEVSAEETIGDVAAFISELNANGITFGGVNGNGNSIDRSI